VSIILTGEAKADGGKDMPSPMEMAPEMASGMEVRCCLLIWRIAFSSGGICLRLQPFLDGSLIHLTLQTVLNLPPQGWPDR